MNSNIEALIAALCFLVAYTNILLFLVDDSEHK